MFDSLFNLNFWLQRTPPPFSPLFERGLFAVFGLMLIVGAIVQIVAGYKKEDKLTLSIFNRIGKFLLWLGGLGLLWYLFSYERIPVLGMRVWFLLWLGGLLLWLAWLVYYSLRIVPRLRAEAVAREERLKYFRPNKRQRKKRKR